MAKYNFHYGSLCHTDNNTLSYIILLLQVTLSLVNQLELQYITITVYVQSYNFTIIHITRKQLIFDNLPLSYTHVHG